MNASTVYGSGLAYSGSPSARLSAVAALSLPSSYFFFYFYSYPRSFADRPGEASE
jgi:hypothetical protein